MTDDLKEAVAKLTGFVRNAHPDHGDVSAFLLKPHIALVLSELKAAERPQPVPGDGEGVKAELAREEAAHLNTIDQRDAAEEALSRAYFLVAGRHPPWSNMFQYSDALAEIEETLAALSRVSTPGREEIADALDGAFVTTVSQGDSDPAKRSASVNIAFRGEGASQRAERAFDALALRRSEPRGDSSLAPEGAPQLASGGNRDQEPSWAAGASLEPRGCPTPGACSCPAPQTPDERARIICDFMGWTEEGPAWTDAHKLAASLSAGVSPGRRAMLASAPKAEVEGWRDIAEVDHCGPVIVCRPTDRLVYAATTAFKDVTGVWRVYRSEGGMTPLPFEPTHWRPLPAPPATRDGADKPVEGEGG